MSTIAFVLARLNRFASRFGRRPFSRRRSGAAAGTLAAVTLAMLAVGDAAVGQPSSPAAAESAPDAETQVQPEALKLARDPAVHRELNLSAEQIRAVEAGLAEVDPRWWRSRILKPSEQAAEVKQLTGVLAAKLKRILTAEQSARWRQLLRQARGTRSLLQPEMAKSLALTSSQQETLRAAFAETDQLSKRIQQSVPKASTDRDAAMAEVQQAMQSELETVKQTLTDDQKVLLGGLMGPTFDFSRVSRTFPRAPEILLQNSQWIGDEAPRLKELRGKVVAVHFYAFQCINCKRNLPHYNGWHEDFADQGLVVIGIQTPETSAERKIDLVREAAKVRGIKYPVLMDGRSENWQAWGTTMWPTVYLIDKDGYIRRWWQGELNWQGTEGEADMRRTIETLLAEDRTGSS